MKVYLLIYREIIAECVMDEIIGVFSTEEKATETMMSDYEAYIHWKELNQYFIQEATIDEVIKYDED